MKQAKEDIKGLRKGEISGLPEDNSFFSKEGITPPKPKNIKKVIRTQNILQFIKENPGTTAYDISKKLEFSYSDVCRIIKDLEYCNAIFIEVQYLESIVRKNLFIPKEVEQ